MSIQSMTGFGRAQAETPIGTLTVELRTINNRFQDLSISLPRELSFVESQLRATLRQTALRGKIDLRIRYVVGETTQSCVTINTELVKKYLEQFKALESLGISGDINIRTLIGLPGILEVAHEELDETEVWEIIKDVLSQALTALLEERTREGDALAEQIQDLLAQFRICVETIHAAQPEILLKWREKLSARLEELTSELKVPLEPGRLELETALFADRSDISEEIVRLRAHLDRFDTLLKGDEKDAVGKAMDFLIQELTRETNTIGSKVRDTQIVSQTLEMKNIIERIREQVQNIQ